MNKDYQIISKKNSRELANFLSKEGQLLLPMLKSYLDDLEKDKALAEKRKAG